MSSFPSRSQLDNPYDVSWGGEISENTTRAGVVDDGLIAWPERLIEARRQWQEAPAEDFEKVGKRLYRDRATGVEYEHVHGTPLLAIGERGSEGISCFFVDGMRLVFLTRADLPRERVVYHGEVIGKQIPTSMPSDVGGLIR